MSTPDYIQQLIESDTNVVFTFGYTGAGKSTLLVALYLYLFEKSRISLNPKYNRDGVNYLKRCAHNLIHNKKLPPITTTNTIKEVDWLCEVKNEKAIFTFLDMPGEDLRMVSPVEKDQTQQTYSDGNLDDEITKYLSNQELSVILLCVIDYERVAKDNELIHSFLDYANKEFNFNFVGAAVVVTKWDKHPNPNENVKAFIKKNAFQTFINLESLVKEPVYLPFSIGKINDQDSSVVEQLDLSYCKPVIEWLHYRALNKPEYSSETDDDKNMLEFIKYSLNQVKEFLGIFQK